ncbi:hypothetical protein [Actinokineospora bangkokensis]|uniref:Uncharacterized protein n=1 Tax=Actinokineospora bangkokensis TaxID=1193682 RepID=A0A1Q9LHC6_9PSEU|nr:hypothetical protein [Actinokineospora bangkokensis]OLR91349.1 hypothetical protein BJP25_27195 [Actinokineospora bangkokensis]
MRARVPLRWWVRPRRAGAVEFLVRSGGAGGPAEQVRFEGALRGLGWRGRRVCAWVGGTLRAVRAVELHCADALAAEARVRGRGEWTGTAAQAQGELRATRAAIEEERGRGIGLHDQVRGPWGTLVSYLLLLVDAVALLVVFGLLLNLDWADPAPAAAVTAVAFAVFGAVVQAELAVEVGRRVWRWRVDSAYPDREHDPAADFPPRALVLGVLCLLLVLVSAAAAASVFLRLRYEGELVDQVGVASVVGAVLAGCAVAAPWVLVLRHAFDGSPLTRRARLLGGVVRRADREWARALRRADRAVGRARARDARAVRVRERVGLAARARLRRERRVVLLARACAGGPPLEELSTPGCAVLDTALAQSAEAVLAARALRASLTGRAAPVVPGGELVRPDW